jgi:hypothetical protein
MENVITNIKRIKLIWKNNLAKLLTRRSNHVHVSYYKASLLKQKQRTKNRIGSVTKIFKRKKNYNKLEWYIKK